MFEKYLNQEKKFVKISFSKNEEYHVSQDGQVFSTVNGICEFGYGDDGRKTIRANLWNGNDIYYLDIVILVAWRKLRLHPTFYHLVETFPLDDDRNNVHVSNIGYSFTRPIESFNHRGYYHIPFFSSYRVNEGGNVINAKTGESVACYLLEPSVSFNKKNVKGGYRYFRLYSDGGFHMIGRHRLKAFAFKPHPGNLDKLDVNHLDGIPGNDDIINLEWATRSRNVEHATESGLRSQNLHCYAKNVLTGEELNAYSAGNLARQLKLNITTVAARLRAGGQKLYEGGWMFKYDKSEPWRVPEHPHEEIKATSSPSKVISKNIFTGEIREHESIALASRELGLEFGGARNQISGGRNRPYYGYLFKMHYDASPWPEFTEREIQMFREIPSGRCRGVVAKNIDGDELFFTHISKAAEHFKEILMKPVDVCKAILNKRNVLGYYLSYYERPLGE